MGTSHAPFTPTLPNQTSCSQVHLWWEKQHWPLPARLASLKSEESGTNDPRSRDISADPRLQSRSDARRIDRLERVCRFMLLAQAITHPNPLDSPSLTVADS